MKNKIFIFILLFFASSSFWIGKRPYILKYEGIYYFPFFSNEIKTGEFFNLNYKYEANFKELNEFWKRQGDQTNFMIFPPLPFDEDEINLQNGDFPPLPPSLEKKHFLGTDSVGRDVLVRLIFGMKNALFFGLVLAFMNIFWGILFGGLMGYLGGIFDLIFQRIVEILSKISILYLLLIFSSMTRPNLIGLIILVSITGWVIIATYVRTLVYKEKEKNYILNLKVLGASHFRILFLHIIPNISSVVSTFIPFEIAYGMSVLVSLDYLGLGTPAPTASLGELLKDGMAHVEAEWISIPPLFIFIMFLIFINFWGESLREKFDPKKNYIFR